MFRHMAHYHPEDFVTRHASTNAPAVPAAALRRRTSVHALSPPLAPAPVTGEGLS